MLLSVRLQALLLIDFSEFVCYLKILPQKVNVKLSPITLQEDFNMNKYLDIAPEVAEALKAGKPVVALESTIISHGTKSTGDFSFNFNKSLTKK